MLLYNLHALRYYSTKFSRLYHYRTCSTVEMVFINDGESYNIVSYKFVVNLLKQYKTLIT